MQAANLGFVRSSTPGTTIQTARQASGDASQPPASGRPRVAPITFGFHFICGEDIDADKNSSVPLSHSPYRRLLICDTVYTRLPSVKGDLELK